MGEEGAMNGEHSPREDAVGPWCPGWKPGQGILASASWVFHGPSAIVCFVKSKAPQGLEISQWEDWLK